MTDPIPFPNDHRPPKTARDWWPDIWAVIAVVVIGGAFAYPYIAQAQDTLSPGDVVTTLVWSDADSGKANGVRFRLADVDAGETRRDHTPGNRDHSGAQCEQEMRLGEAAAEWVEATTEGRLVTVGRVRGTYTHGRATIWLNVDGEDLGRMGLDAGQYRSWRHVGTRAVEARPDWCL